MAHDFLTSLHSHVIDTSIGKKVGPKPPDSGTKEADTPILIEPPKPSAEPDERHRTIGISMSPRLRERAAARAAEVGLSLSRYVQWCIEAELDGAPLESRFKARSDAEKLSPSPGPGIGRGGKGIGGILRGRTL
jgi:hypothetical protein